MKRLLILLALSASVIWGCGKKDKSATAANPQLTPEQAAQIESEYILPTNQASAVAPADSATVQDGAARQLRQAQAAQPVQQRLQGAMHAQLTIQLRIFIEKNGRVPGSFSEFVNSAMDSVPPAPDGMKFVIDPVDRAVKVVRK